MGQPENLLGDGGIIGTPLEAEKTLFGVHQQLRRLFEKTRPQFLFEIVHR
jgi:hypothetical protein